MKNIRFFSTILFLLLISNFLSAQTYPKVTRFTDTAFVKELTRFYKPNPDPKIKLPKDQDSVLTAFITMVESGRLSVKETKLILEVSNYFLKKRLNKKNDFLTYLGIVPLLKKSSITNLIVFHEFIIYTSKSALYTLTDVKKLLIQIHGLEKNKYITTTRLHKWTTDSKAYKFVFDKKKNELNIIFDNITVGCKFKINKGIKKLRRDKNGDTLRNKYGVPLYEKIRGYVNISMIKNTKGIYNPLEKYWIGTGGKVTWERVGKPANAVYAELGKYTINMANKEFTADSVKFTNSEVLSETVPGKYSDKISDYLLDKDVYPKFSSYDNHIKLEKIIDNVDFAGGIAMNGKTIIGFGTDTDPAEVKLYRKGDVFLLAKSMEFVLRKKEIFSENATIIINQTPESTILHQSVEAVIRSNTFTLKRSKASNGKTNFIDSYHKLAISSFGLEWKNDTALYFIGGGANFESASFFSGKEYEKIQMHDDNNPLFEILRFVKYRAAKIKYENAIADNDYDALKAMKMKDFYNDYKKKDADFRRLAKTLSHQEVTELGITGFYAYELSRFLKKKPAPVRFRLIDLSEAGFVSYDPTTKWTTVNPKLYHYTDARSGVKDYDDLTFGATARDGNVAAISLNTMDMNIPYPHRITISKTRRTAFDPSADLIVKKNRDMEFSGTIRTGLVKIKGTNFKFNYDNYKVSFINADSAFLRVLYKENDTSKIYKTKNVNSTLENLTGELEIEKKGNLSGKDASVTNYPILTTSKKSSVHYDKKNKQGDAYKHDEFFFDAEVFTIDSLANLREGSLAFSGKMNAGGIVPDFNDKLTVQSDGSLGFVHETTGNVIDIFGGKGKLRSKSGDGKSNVNLSNNGFGASGEITWLTTITRATDFIFLPATVSSDTASIIINKSKTGNKAYPQVAGEKIKMTWNAEADSMLYTTTDKPVKMYDKKVTLKGNFVYTPKDLTGNGTVKLYEGTLISTDYRFRENDFKSYSTDAFIKQDSAKAAQSNMMNTYVNLKAGKAVFQRRNDESVIKLVSEYTIEADHYVWDIGKKKFHIDTDITELCDPAKMTEKNVPLDKNYLTDVCAFTDKLFLEEENRSLYKSTQKDREGLKFYGKKSDFDSKTGDLTVHEVLKINVADIVVTPATDVIIRKNGLMDSLVKTVIRDTSGVHTITNVNITIDGRNEYRASSGIYQYIDENETAQNIYFKEIYFSKQDKNRRSVGEGIIEKDSTFTLSPAFEYHGNVQFNANEPSLRFYGFARLKHTCASEPFWFNFDARIAPDSIYIPMKPLMNSDTSYKKAKIMAAVITSMDSVHVYTSFLSNMPDGKKGIPLLNVRDSGNYVFYDKKLTKYRISNLAKIKDRSLTGNYLDLETQNCKVYGEGKINFSNETKVNKQGKYVITKYIYGQFEIESVGVIYNDIEASKVDLETMTSFNFFFDKKALSLINQTIEEAAKTQSFKAVDITKSDYVENMQEYMGVEKTTAMMTEYAENSGVLKKLPKELQKTLVFTDLKLRWDTESKSFKSQGDIGIGSINGVPINKYVKGKVQIHKTRHGAAKGKVDIYLEITPDKWFYFTYMNGVLRGSSSIEEFKLIVTKLKDRDRKPTFPKGERHYSGKPYIYFWTSDTTKDNFLKGFKTGVTFIDDDENLDKFEDEFDDDTEDDEILDEDNPDEDPDDE